MHNSVSRISLENSSDSSRTIPSEFLSVFRTKIWIDPVSLHHLLRQKWPGKKIIIRKKANKKTLKPNIRRNLLTVCQSSLCWWLLMDYVSGNGISSPRTPMNLWGDPSSTRLPFPNFSQQTVSLSLSVHINKENTSQSWACKPNCSKIWGTKTQELAGGIVLWHSPRLLSHTDCPLSCRL